MVLLGFYIGKNIPRLTKYLGRFLYEDLIRGCNLGGATSFFDEEARGAFLDLVKGMIIWHLNKKSGGRTGEASFASTKASKRLISASVY